MKKGDERVWVLEQLVKYVTDLSPRDSHEAKSKDPYPTQHAINW